MLLDVSSETSAWSVGTLDQHPSLGCTEASNKSSNAAGVHGILFLFLLVTNHRRIVRTTNLEPSGSAEEKRLASPPLTLLLLLNALTFSREYPLQSADMLIATSPISHRRYWPSAKPTLQ